MTAAGMHSVGATAIIETMERNQMPWFKVDDNLAFHAKTIAAGNAAMGLWVRAGSWCSQQLTDGHVPAHVAAQLGRPAEIKRLVESGLWRAVDEGYQFHDYHDRNPSREKVHADRAENAKRLRDWRERKRNGGETDV